MSEVRALSLDLDDTLWPFAPIFEAIQAATKGWMADHAPRTAAWHTHEKFMEFALAVRAELLGAGHTLAAIRHETLRRILEHNGDDPERARELGDIAYEARQQIEFHPDAEPALDRLARKFDIVAITNGNADPRRAGLDKWFVGYVAADEFGAAKPDPSIFHAGCELLGVPAAEVLHVGDDLHTDVEGALGAGLQAAWLHRDLTGETPEGVLRVKDLTALADVLDA